jgi:putative membrane protein
MILGKENVIQNRGYSAIVGIVLVAVGTVTSVLSYIRYRQTTRQLKEGCYIHSSLLITVITAFIFFVSVLLIAYLIESI